MPNLASLLTEIGPLFRQAASVGGQWLDHTHYPCLDVVNPATQERIGQVPILPDAQIEAAIHHSVVAQRAWRTVPAKQRSLLLKQWFRLICEHVKPLALLLTLEQGKPVKDAEIELLYAASFIEWFAEEARRIQGSILPPMVERQKIDVLMEPVGVTAAITPWNFPAAMITRKAGAALAAGCSMIIKPAEDTPFTALALAYLAELAGIPAGVLQVVTGEPVAIARVLMAADAVRKISFTGSTEVGKRLMAQSAPTLKRLSLELGGNAPFIVFEDADLESAVAGLLEAKLRNYGQTCINPNRIFLHRSCAAQVISLLHKAISEWKVGDGFDPANQAGPLINAEAVAKVERLIASALDSGAELVCVGTRLQPGSLFFAPTILQKVRPDMEIAQEEIFGPVIAIQLFDTEEEVVAAANATEYGLVAYAYTQNLARYHRLQPALDFGMIGLNSTTISLDQVPFGGVKHSGFGREGSTLGIKEYLQTKLVMGRV